MVRATPLKLRLFLGSQTKFNDPQGVACVRLLSWDDPTITKDDDEVTVYGVNSGDNCIIYNLSMYKLGIYGLDKSHEKLNRPWGIAANEIGVVYVADMGNSRVVELFNPGNGLIFKKQIGGPGDAPGSFIEPRGVAIGADGRLYVTDSALDRITVFDSSGGVLTTWDGFKQPDGIAVVGPREKTGYHRSDAFVVVVDSMHSRVSKYKLTGELISQVSSSSFSSGQTYLAYVVVDYHNNILLTDKKNCQIHKLDRNLNYITSFGRRGKKDYEFDEPRGIAIYRYFGQTFVAEREGAQYLWVAVDVPEFEAEVFIENEFRDLRVHFYLTEPAIMELDILDSYGRFIARIVSGRRYNQGEGHLSWGLIIPEKMPGVESKPVLPPGCEIGKQIPDGEYIIKAKFRATYSSRKSFVKEVETRFKLSRH